MKKIYSLFLSLSLTALAFAQTTTTTSITNTGIGGSAVLGSNNYNSGAERTWSADGVSFGGKYITSNQNNTPTGNSANTLVQAQSNNGVIYNTSALPGRIVSLTINYVGTANDFTFSGGNSSRLVNSSTGSTTITGGTTVGSASSTGWTATDFVGTNYTYFAIKKNSGASYVSSIVIEYETSGTLSTIEIKGNKNAFVKNTVVNNEISFGSEVKDVKVYNMLGQVVKVASVKVGETLEVSDLEKGNYIVTGTVNNEAVSQKVIKK